MGQKARERRAAQTERERLPKWTAFERGTPTVSPERRQIMAHDMVARCEQRGTPISLAEAFRQIDVVLTRELYENSRYVVIIDRAANRLDDQWPQMIHLSIRRVDRGPVGTEHFRDFQRIKDELLGPEYEAVEIYPAADRLVDSVDQFHLWAFSNDGLRFPFGFNGGRFIREPDETDALGITGQSAFRDGAR